MSYNHYLPQKVDLTPKRHHGFQVVLFFLGWLLPPLAVAVRFGIGRDFFINIILTLCGYIPGHGHNFYIQNIRNNSNKARTPKWAIRYGLVNNAERERKARKSQWAKRYDERLPESTFVGQELAEGEEGPNYVPTVPGQQKRRPSEGLWDREDEIYYNEDEAPNQSNWHYPMNFEGTVGDGRSRRNRLNRTASRGSDRWERTRTARADTASSQDSYGSYPPKAATDDDVPVWGKDYGRQRRSSRGSGGSGGNGGRKNDPDAVFNHEF